MNQIKKCFRMINPFNNMEDMPIPVFILKKILAFLIIYYVSGVLGEAIIIGGFTAMGYDPLHGDMPSGEIAGLVKYYVFAVFLIVTLLYCAIVEKRSPKKLGFNKKITDYLPGIGIAVVLLGIIIGICTACGKISYLGINKDIDVKYILLLFGGLVIQGAAEEALCRGVVLTSLAKKVPLPIAVFFSATAFAFPHFFTLFDADIQFALLGLVNLYLVSTVFSMLVLIRSNIWASCGLHSIWNFLLYGIFGLTLSGNETEMSGVFCFKAEGANIFNGGVYGIEASIITTVVLGIAVVVLCLYAMKRDPAKQIMEE